MIQGNILRKCKTTGTGIFLKVLSSFEVIKNYLEEIQMAQVWRNNCDLFTYGEELFTWHHKKN